MTIDPKTEIVLPAQAMERIAVFHAQEQAADMAASSLMNSAIVDWQGQETSLLSITQSIGNDEHIRNAARDVFMALTSEGMTYREFTERMASPLKAVSTSSDIKRAVNHFHTVMSDSHDLQSMGLGRGDLLLIPFDWHVNNYLKAHPAQAKARLAS